MKSSYVSKVSYRAAMAIFLVMAVIVLGASVFPDMYENGSAEKISKLARK